VVQQLSDVSLAHPMNPAPHHGHHHQRRRSHGPRLLAMETAAEHLHHMDGYINQFCTISKLTIVIYIEKFLGRG